jgi:hypothetical protein
MMEIRSILIDIQKLYKIIIEFVIQYEDDYILHSSSL